MEGLIGFMNTGLGRGLRVVLGLALIYIGLAFMGGTAGWIVAAIGLLPIVMGAWGRCLLEFAMPRAKHA